MIIFWQGRIMADISVLLILNRLWTCEDLLLKVFFVCHTYTYQSYQPRNDQWHLLLAIRKPEASNTVIFSASLSSAPPSLTSLISPMLATVIEFHTKRICDAYTRWFCACKMMCCVSLAFALSFSRSLSSLYLKALAMLPKLVSKHYS